MKNKMIGMGPESEVEDKDTISKIKSRTHSWQLRKEGEKRLHGSRVETREEKKSREWDSVLSEMSEGTMDLLEREEERMQVSESVKRKESEDFA